MSSSNKENMKFHISYSLPCHGHHVCERCSRPLVTNSLIQKKTHLLKLGPLLFEIVIPETTDSVECKNEEAREGVPFLDLRIDLINFEDVECSKSIPSKGYIRYV